MEIVFSLLAAGLPLLLFVFGFIPSKRKKSLKQKVLPGLITLLTILLITLFAHLYFLFAYGFPLLPTKKDAMFSIILLSVFAGIFLFCGVVAHIIGRRQPKTVHNPVAMVIILCGLLFELFLVFLWFAPLGQKWEYANILDRAQQAFAKSDADNQEITVELLYSGRFCAKRCTSEDRYRNLFLVKNQLNQPVQVSVYVSAFNDRKEHLKTSETASINLQPGEYRVLMSSETDLEKSIWDRWTFYTDQQVAYFQYDYKKAPLIKP